MKLFLISSIFLTGCINSISTNQQLKNIVNFQSRQISNELPVHLLGFGISEPDEIREFMVSYQTNQSVNLEEARKLIVQLADSLIENINFNFIKKELIQKHLDLSFFYISIGFDGDQTPFNETEGEIARVSLYKGIINYKIAKPGNRDFTINHSESYEEAYQIVYGKKEND